MTISQHDSVVLHIARTRFPFHDQKDWPADYVTLTNVERPTRSIPFEGAEHFPDIVIVNTKGEVREIGEIEEALDEAKVAIWRTCSLAADNLTETGNRHFFLYVPQGLEDKAVALLDRHAISFAGVRGYVRDPSGAVRITPHVTRGDSKDHR
ncbi:hypothetical protein [Taklimakanibacter deserti]|uniref:hypothetical protein n=1 Tax=Taklimakanibacter deserti TaxID=2267839 RepID=UPI000E65122B